MARKPAAPSEPSAAKPSPESDPARGLHGEIASLKDQLLKTQAELGRAHPYVQQAQTTDRLHRRLIAVIQEERISPGLAMEALHRVELDLLLQITAMQTGALLQQHAPHPHATPQEDPCPQN